MALPAADPARSIPVLPSPDIKATRDFYRDQLGFGIVGPEMDDYLIMRRNEMEIHFWKSDDRKLPEVSSCYLRGGE
ncbi:VOC family protein, partial [Mesorhizobium sp. M6A.T.Cr.TU.017.01.1.1]